jgi:hypothetical protein
MIESIFDRRSMTEKRAIDRRRADDRHAVDGAFLLHSFTPLQARSAVHAAPRMEEIGARHGTPVEATC